MVAALFYTGFICTCLRIVRKTLLLIHLLNTNRRWIAFFLIFNYIVWSRSFLVVQTVYSCIGLFLSLQFPRDTVFFWQNSSDLSKNGGCFSLRMVVLVRRKRGSQFRRNFCIILQVLFFLTFILLRYLFFSIEIVILNE